jgi:ferrous iron transport protein B
MTSDPPPAPARTIVLIGRPNVGKSALFNALCREYVTVSNYPGTTVEVSRGTATVGNQAVQVVDTPGMYSLHPISEEERVSLRLLFDERPSGIVHVVDAKNLERMLPMTLQLIEAGLPVVLALNMMDEAGAAGLRIDLDRLSRELGIPVIPTVSTRREGMDSLRAGLEALFQEPRPHAAAAALPYPPRVRRAIEELASHLEAPLSGFGLTAPAVALMLLRDEEEAWARLEAAAGPQAAGIRAIVDSARHDLPLPVDYYVAITLQEKARHIVAQVLIESPRGFRFADVLSQWMMRPLTGIPFLLLVLYLGLYKFVGGFGAGTVVDLLEDHVFGSHVNPFLIEWSERLIPWPVLRDLFTGDYGVLTLGVRYAVALILPIVTFFFLFFAVIEDSGYLPRLALLVDRVFKGIGLSGRAVIPMVLGLGCDTMATLVTRTLPTRRERVIATLLLALAVPCSAQLGVILALLEGRPAAVGVWALVLGLVFLLVGFLAARVMPGERASFYIEVPPLRWPDGWNVLTKTYVRIRWYFMEIMPLFILASVLIWLGKLCGLFDLLVRLLQEPVRWIGLPPETAPVFLFGFFRRDYGAAGLYDLHKADLLTGVQLTVASVALTLFLPCVAQFLMNVKERGWKVGIGISTFVLFFSFGVAYVLNAILSGLGIAL